MYPLPVHCSRCGWAMAAQDAWEHPETEEPVCEWCYWQIEEELERKEK